MDHTISDVDKTEFYGDWIHSNEPAAANIGRTALFVQNLYPRHSDKLIKKNN